MAAKVLVSLEDAVLSYGGKPIFDGVGMHICEGEKICLVGKNGAGKTTLMKLLMNELELDGGKRFALPGLTIGYLAQVVHFDPHLSVQQFILMGLREEDQQAHALHLVDQVLEPLGLDETAKMGTLSGGQLRRAALARALLYEPDLLILDEPTNHLDLAAIEWLESMINRSRSAVLVVSHDRKFLENISRKVLWIDRGNIRTCPKGYAEFDEWAEVILQQEAREIHNMQKKFEAEVDWTQGGVSARRKRNQRRLRELERLRAKLKTDKASHKKMTSRIELDPLAPTQASKIVAEFRGVSKHFMREGRKIPILEDFTFRITRGDRIGILGKNGSGKSTFIKLLMSELEPDAGRVFRGKNMEVAYFDQNRVDLKPEKSVWDILCPQGGDYVLLGDPANPKPIHVCGYLKNFLFDPRIARDKVSTLSGGQQNRLMLAKVLAHPGNVLILDEPTNDLDMDTLDMLQEILADYQGTLILVSHDRDFLDRTVTEVLAFEGDALVESYLGGYSDYIAAKKKLPTKKAEIEKPAIAAPTPEKKQNNKMTFKLKHELEQLPARITKLETEIAELKETLSDSDLYTRDAKLFDTASHRLVAAQNELEESELRWLELEEMTVDTNS